MPSIKRIPIQHQLGTVSCSPAAMPTTVELPVAQAESPRKRGCDEVRVQIVKRAKEGDGGAGGTITEDPVDGNIEDARGEPDGVVASEENASEPDVLDTNSTSKQAAAKADESSQNTAPETIELQDSSSPSSENGEEEETVTPHPLTSINHNILGRLISTPFHSRAMKTLFLHANDAEWDDIIPAVNLPVCGQKRFVGLLKDKMQAKPLSDDHAGTGRSENGNVAAGNVNNQQIVPTEAQILRQFQSMSGTNLNNQVMDETALIQQIQQQLIQQSIPTASHQNDMSQQTFWTTLIQTANNQANASILNSLYGHNMQTAYAAPTQPVFLTTSPQASGYSFEQFRPAGLNTGNYEQYRMAMHIAQATACTSANNASQLAASGRAAPQATASKPMVLTKSNMASMAKLPVAFGFELNNGQSIALANSSSRTYAQEAHRALQNSGPRFKRTPNKAKEKTPRKSPATTPNTTPRMSPKLVPSSEHHKSNLPAGWSVKTFLRQGGDSAGTTDTYFYSPRLELKFRSIKKVKLFCDILAECGDDETRAHMVFKERGYKK